MVYGEFITDAALELAKIISKNIPAGLTTTYFTNSGTEAIEASIKLARRYTGKKKIIGAEKAYHGSTLGSLTLMGMEEKKKPFEPLIPMVDFIKYGFIPHLRSKTSKYSRILFWTLLLVVVGTTSLWEFFLLGYVIPCFFWLPYIRFIAESSKHSNVDLENEYANSRNNVR